MGRSRGLGLGCESRSETHAAELAQEGVNPPTEKLFDLFGAVELHVRVHLQVHVQVHAEQRVEFLGGRTDWRRCGMPESAG